MRGGAWAAFLNAGQVCTSAERVYVEHSVYEDFVSALVEHAHTLRVGTRWPRTPTWGR